MTARGVRRGSSWRSQGGRVVGTKYVPPERFETTSLNELLRFSGRFSDARRGDTIDLFQPKAAGQRNSDLTIYAAGDLSLLKAPCVSIIGTRQVSELGVRRAQKLAASLAVKGVVVLSGLAMGVDTAAHTAAIEHGGRTIAVIGTPLDRCNPTRNAALQQKIYTEHLLLSQFAWGSTVYPSNFPQRNKLMAAIADATVIIEASDTSGTLHQAVECVRLGRPLFILQSLIDDPTVKWPKEFLRYDTVRPLASPDDVSAVLNLGAGAGCR